MQLRQLNLLLMGKETSEVILFLMDSVKLRFILVQVFSNAFQQTLSFLEILVTKISLLLLL